MGRMRGFSSALIVLFFLSASLALSKSLLDAKSGMLESRNLLLEMENANLARSLMEENLDLLVEKTLRKEMAAGNRNPDKLKKLLDKKIEGYLKEVQEFYGNEFETGFGVEFLGYPFPKSVSQALKENSKVHVVSLKNFHFGEFNYTGGASKSETISAEILGKKNSTKFLIPAGYSARVLVVGA